MKGTHPVSDGDKATGEEGGPLPEGQPPRRVARSSVFSREDRKWILK